MYKGSAKSPPWNANDEYYTIEDGGQEWPGVILKASFYAYQGSLLIGSASIEISQRIGLRVTSLTSSDTQPS